MARGRDQQPCLREGAQVPVISVPEDFHTEDLYVDLRSVLAAPLYLKCEGFNFAGSIKLKAARR